MGHSPPGSTYNEEGIGLPLLNGPTEFGDRSPSPTTWTTSPTRKAVSGDVLFCVRGSTTGRMNRADQEYCIGRGIAAIRGDTAYDTEFLHAALRANLDRLLMLTTGSTFPNLSRKDLETFNIPWPEGNQRHRIAHIAMSLDDKVENNRRLAKALEEIAAALFKARFLDFIGYDDLTESDIGPIAPGWRTVALSEAVEINPPVRAIKKGLVVPHIGMADVPAWGVRPSRIESREYAGGARFEPGDTLMARITGCIEHGKGAFIDFLARPGAGSTEFLVLRARSPLTPEMVFLLCRTARVRGHAIANMSGSSGRQRVQTSSFDHIKIAVPPNAEAVEREASILRATFSQTHALWRENNTVTLIRDVLLPRLISGKMFIPPDAAPRLENA